MRQKLYLLSSLFYAKFPSPVEVPATLQRLWSFEIQL